jgi:hypothetical protein
VGFVFTPEYLKLHAASVLVYYPLHDVCIPEVLDLLLCAGTRSIHVTEIRKWNVLDEVSVAVGWNSISGTVICNCFTKLAFIV